MRSGQETQLPLFSRDEETSTPGTLALEAYNSRILREFNEYDEQAILTSIKPETFTFESNPKPQKNISPPTTIDEIYVNPEFTSAELQTALKLLAKCETLANKSIVALQNGKAILSDEIVIEIQSYLPELFACRALGDSYGALINSIQNALINSRGFPFSLQQLAALRDIISSTRQQPFMRFEKAMDLIDDFESHDFLVEPITLQFLTSFFDEP